ncbi:MAG: SpoIIE family protein phosphatase [bacterium]|nr:SpoIIE family protein phosphatase [bacterium]
MRIQIKSISTKIGLLYVFLAIVNISIFTILIYENQVDLIRENTQYQITEYTASLLGSLNELSEKMASQKKSRKAVLAAIDAEFKQKMKHNRMIKRVMIFTEQGKKLYASDPELKVSDKDINHGIMAPSGVEFAGSKYYSIVDKDLYLISFYIPLEIYRLKGTILTLQMSMENFDEKMSTVYRIITVVIGFITVFHLLFGFFLFRLIIRPIKSLSTSSMKISEGDLTVRTDIGHDDEIGRLGTAFNGMAASIQEKIEMLEEYNTRLKQYNEKMDTELSIAGDVQRSIVFPRVEETDSYKYSLFFEAFARVSGDYYDIFDLGDSRHGFLLVDASGHGVPAALLTMIVKEQFRVHAPVIDDPAELFKKVNSEITAILKNALGFYFSAFYLILDDKKRITFCNAGHVVPYIIRKKKKGIRLLNTNGFLVGISPDMGHMYETRSTELETGDKIILYTDGITEHSNKSGEEFGNDRLLGTMKKNFNNSGDQILKAIIDDMNDFSSMENLKDDTTLIIIDIK